MKKRILSYGLLLSTIGAVIVAAPATKGSKMSKQAKIAFVDMRTMLSQDPATLKDDAKVLHEWRDFYNKFLATIQPTRQERAEIQAQIEKKAKELEALQKSGVSTPEAVRKKAEEEIGPLQYKFQMISQQLQGFEMSEMNRIQSIILPKLQKAVDGLCKSQGWDFVINREALLSSPGANSDFDITSDVLKVLNADYAASKKQAAPAA